MKDTDTTLLKSNPSRVERCADMLKVIAHPTRMTIVEMLYNEGDLSVTQVYEMLGIEQAVASHHLAQLRNKGIISSQRDGKNVLYTLKIRKLYDVVNCVKCCSNDEIRSYAS